MTHYNSISPPASSISSAVSMAKSEGAGLCYNDHHVAPPNCRPLEKGATIENVSLQRHQPSHRNGSLESDVVENNLVEINNVKNRFAEGEPELAKTAGAQRGGDNEIEACYSSSDDFQIWLPPEPDDQEDDVEGSVANYEDDDDEEEFDDGMKWGKPSNLSSFGQEGSGSFRFREDKRKAMDEVMSGKFKALVEHLLRSMGISCLRNNGDTWVDIVTSLSWKAASFLKPYGFEGKAMDPEGYVKVKCIATGSRSQRSLSPSITTTLLLLSFIFINFFMTKYGMASQSSSSEVSSRSEVYIPGPSMTDSSSNIVTNHKLNDRGSHALGATTSDNNASSSPFTKEQIEALQQLLGHISTSSQPSQAPSADPLTSLLAHQGGSFGEGDWQC